MANEEKITRIEPIRITDKETHHEYILDFDRAAVEFCESRDFDWDLIVVKPVTMIPLVWWASFRRYQQNKVSRAEADALLEKIGGMTPAILARLRQLYDQGIESLINLEDEADEEAAKNSMVTVEM